MRPTVQALSGSAGRRSRRSSSCVPRPAPTPTRTHARPTRDSQASDRAHLLPFPTLQDDFWQNLVLGMVGETIDPSDEICGARVVDKSTGQRQMYRLELWFKRKDQATADELLSRMQTCLGPYVKTCKWEFRPH